MSRPMRTLGCLLAAALGLTPGLATRAADDDTEAARGKEGLAAFRAYLKKQYPDKKWQAGPSRLDSPALRAAYGGQRFYFVFSRPPLPPGANLGGVQDAYRRKVEEIRKNYVSLTARVDDRGQVVPLRKPKDYNGGLKKVASDNDARAASAAILSLYGSGQISPGVVKVSEVRVTKSDKGWSYRVNRPRAFQGAVTFDPEGQCTGVSKVYTGPRPR